ncbi:hypothetical protein GCM10009765_54950 [Fodinicola feengrottensis]|uniref:Uncharacterized protein n=1 Tax=Fodinicola feengrottensis TaxID=435914 RepID=A0ABN2I5C8_9ACTN
MTVPTRHVNQDTQNVLRQTYLIGPRRALHARPGPAMWRRVAGRLGASSADLKAIARTLPATLTFDGMSQFFTEMVGGRVGHADYFGLVSAMSNPVQGWRKIADHPDSDLYRLACSLVSAEGVTEFARPQRPVDAPAVPDRLAESDVDLPTFGAMSAEPRLTDVGSVDPETADVRPAEADFVRPAESDFADVRPAAAEVADVRPAAPEPEVVDVRVEAEPVVAPPRRRGRHSAPDADEIPKNPVPSVPENSVPENSVPENIVPAEVVAQSQPPVETVEALEPTAGPAEPVVAVDLVKAAKPAEKAESVEMVEPAEAEPVETTEPAEAEPATVESEPRLEKTADAARTQVTVENPEHDTVIDVDFADGELDLRDYDQGQEEVTGAHLIASFAQRDRLVDRLGERDTVINKLVDAIGNRDEAIEHRDQMIGMLVERDRLIERLFARLDERDAVINRLAEAIGKRDKAIEQRDQMITVLIEKVERYAQPEPAVRPGTPEPARTDRPLAHHGGQHTVSHPMSSQPVDTVEVPPRTTAEPFPSRTVRGGLPGIGARPAAALSHRSRLQGAAENGFDQRVLSAAELAQVPLGVVRRPAPGEPGAPAVVPARVSSQRPPDARP